MPQKLHRVRIFVSCPDEMHSQVSIVDVLAQELSPFFEDGMSVTLKVLNWKLDIAPGVDSDPQARVNAQLTTTFILDSSGRSSGHLLHALDPARRTNSDRRMIATRRIPARFVCFYFKTDVASVHNLIWKSCVESGLSVSAL